MPKVHSKPRANIQVVPKELKEDGLLGHLEEKIQNAVQAITVLRKERDSLKEKLGEAGQRLKHFEQDQSRGLSKDATLKALAQERDDLFQDRQNTIRRVETMLERLKALGLR